MLLGTIILSTEGINGSVAGNGESINKLLSILEHSLFFKHLIINRTKVTTEPFDRMVVRIKPEIVTSDFENLSFKDSQYVEPEDWDHFIRRQGIITMDVRNFYEHSIGSFVNSWSPNIRRFRELQEIVFKELKKHRQRKIAIYCTGGIRCEKASSLLRGFGFHQIFQLKGGIFNYFQKRTLAKDSQWKGDCFVFDKRLAVDNKFRTLNYEQCPGCKGMIPKKDIAYSESEWAHCPSCESNSKAL